jgi:hypothetical protein
MTMKKWIIAGAVLAAACLLAWFWVSRGPSEAETPNNAAGDSNGLPAAVARVKRGNIGDTLSIAGASSRSRKWTYMPKFPGMSKPWPWTLATM